MRTTYKIKNSVNSNDVKGNVESVQKNQNVNTSQPRNIPQVNNNVEQRVNTGVSSPEKNVQATQKVIKEGNKPVKKKSKGPIIAIIIGIVLLLLCGVSGGLYFFVIRGKLEEKRISEQNEEVLNQIKSLYNEDSDIVDGITVEDISTIESTLPDDTYKENLEGIKLYIMDRDKVKEFEDSEFSISQEGYSANLNSILSNTDNYNSDSLKTKMSERVLSLQEEYDLYSKIKSELSSITDYSSVDLESYLQEIGDIKHSAENKELTDLYTNACLKKSEQESSSEASSEGDTSLEDPVSSEQQSETTTEDLGPISEKILAH